MLVHGAGDDQHHVLGIEILLGNLLHIGRGHGGDQLTVGVKVVEAEMVTLARLK